MNDDEPVATSNDERQARYEILDKNGNRRAEAATKAEADSEVKRLKNERKEFAPFEIARLPASTSKD